MRLRVGSEARVLGSLAFARRDQRLAVDLEQRDGPLVQVRVVVEHLHVDARRLYLVRHRDVVEVDDARERARQVLRVEGGVDQDLRAAGRQARVRGVAVHRARGGHPACRRRVACSCTARAARRLHASPLHERATEQRAPRAWHAGVSAHLCVCICACACARACACACARVLTSL